MSLLLPLLLLAAAPSPSGHARDGSTGPPRLWIMQNMWGLNAVPSKDAEWPIEEKIARLKAAGFDGVDLHVMGTDPAAPARVRELTGLARKHGLRIGAATSVRKIEDLRTIAYTEAIPDLRFDLDLSHYVVAGEIGGSLSPEAERRFDVVMRRAAMLDGRVSNGEQVQVDMGPAADNAPARVFAGLRDPRPPGARVLRPLGADAADARPC